MQSSQASPRVTQLNPFPNQVIVTGGAGWLGKRLVQSLVHGLDGVPPFEEAPAIDSIRVLVHTEADLAELPKHPRLKPLVGDLRDPQVAQALCAGAEGAILFHTAGIIHVRRVREFYDINTGGTQHLLDAAVAHRLKRAVIVSSNSPAGCNPTPEHRFDENTPYNPYLGYGKSKMLMEQLVQRTYEAGQIETVCVRPPWFYGPDQPARQTLFFKMIRDGKVPIVGSGENRRSMVYVDNLCQGLLRAALVPHANGQLYWIADEHAYTMNQVVDTIEALIETEFQIPVRHRRMRLPHFAGELATWLDRGAQKLGLYQQKLHVLGEMNKNIACSIAKAQAELGYQPTIALREGMYRSLADCLKRQLL